MIMGPGSPISISSASTWKGSGGPTNGNLMPNVDGRVPALKQGFSRIDVGVASVLQAAQTIPWGNGLWRDYSTIDTEPGVVKTEKPAAGVFLGILPFNQAWQTGHPAQNWGLPTYARSDMICKGYVSYKKWMAAVGQEANYLAYCQGDKTQNIPAVRLLYEDAIALLKAGSDGDKLGMFFANASGFPIIQLVPLANQAAPSMTGATFAGFCEISEPEYETIFLSLGI